MIRQAASSLQYVPVRLRVNDQGAPYNPAAAGDAVEMAFTAIGSDPQSGDWKPGVWDGTALLPPDNSVVALCLVGPGGDVELGVGRYTIWLRVTDTPEVPVLEAGQLQIY